MHVFTGDPYRISESRIGRLTILKNPHIDKNWVPHKLVFLKSYWSVLILILDRNMGSSVKYLLSLAAIRERAAIVGKAAKEGHLNNFDVDESKLQAVAEYVTDTIKVGS
jgi:hypothetical protein